MILAAAAAAVAAAEPKLGTESGAAALEAALADPFDELGAFKLGERGHRLLSIPSSTRRRKPVC